MTLATEELVNRVMAWKEDMLSLNYRIRLLDTPEHSWQKQSYDMEVLDNEFIAVVVPEECLRIGYFGTSFVVFNNQVSWTSVHVEEGKEYLVVGSTRNPLRYFFRYDHRSVTHPALIYMIVTNRYVPDIIVPMRPGRDVTLLTLTQTHVIGMIPPGVTAGQFVAQCEQNLIPTADVKIANHVRSLDLFLRLNLKATVTSPEQIHTNIQVKNDAKLDNSEDQYRIVPLATAGKKSKVTIHLTDADPTQTAKDWQDDFSALGYKISHFPEMEVKAGAEPTKILTKPGTFYSLIVPQNGVSLLGANTENVLGALNLETALIVGGQMYVVAMKVDDKVTVQYMTPPHLQSVLYVVAFKHWDWKSYSFDVKQQAIMDRILLRADRRFLFLSRPERRTTFVMLPAKDKADQSDDVTTELAAYAKFGHLTSHYQRSLVGMATRSIITITTTRQDMSLGSPWIRFVPFEQDKGFRHVSDSDFIVIEPWYPEGAYVDEDEQKTLTYQSPTKKMKTDPDEPPEEESIKTVVVKQEEESSPEDDGE